MFRWFYIIFSYLPMHQNFQPIDNGFYNFHSFEFRVSPCDVDCGKNHCKNSYTL